MKQTILSIIIIVLFLTSAFVCFGQPEVSIYSQPDSPLQLSNLILKQRVATDEEGRKWNMLTVAFVSQNVSDKIIRAYAIREFEGDFDKDLGAVIFSYAPTTTSAFFKPSQTYHHEIGETGYSEQPKEIKLAVDFVEFADGSTWGKDLSHSAQQSAGVRAGIKATLEFLKKIHEQSDIETAIKALDGTKNLLPPENESEIWKRGFRTGANSIKYRIKRAYENEGTKGAKAELQKSFNVSQ